MQSPHWDPLAPQALQDPLQACDEMRRRCPLAHGEQVHWTLFRHADVLRVLEDPATFGSAVSRHLAVPNGMDPPAHTGWRRLIDRYFTPELVARHESECRRIARERVHGLPAAGEVEWMGQFAHDYALHTLCAWVGWPDALHEPLRAWTQRQQAAARAGDREALAALAVEFDGHIRAQLEARRSTQPPPDDLTTRLLRDEIAGRPLADEEIVSILRNWTAGELATMAASVGILAHYLATHPGLQQRLRGQPALLPAAIDEILRIHAPLAANRRIVRQATELAGRQFAPGERLTLLWTSAQRDEAVFGDPDEFRLDRDPALNLLYGAGIHACPGAGLARLQLRVVMEELLATTGRIAATPGARTIRARWPASGFERLPLRVERRK